MAFARAAIKKAKALKKATAKAKLLHGYRESGESPTAITTVAAAASAGGGSVPGDYANIFEDAASSREGSAYEAYREDSIQIRTYLNHLDRL